MDETLNKLIMLSKKRFNKESIEITSNDDIFSKLGIDSMEALNLLSEIETNFNIEIPDYEIANISTFAELATLINKKI